MPVVGAISVEADGQQLAAVTRRPMAGTAVDGVITLLLHRRMLDFDTRGDDAAVVSDTLVLMTGAAPLPTAMASVVSAHEPEVMMFAAPSAPAVHEAACQPTWQAPGNALPPSVHLVGAR